MQPLGMVLFGAGHLGQYHLDKMLAHPAVEVVAVVDPDPKRQAEARRKVGAHQKTGPVEICESLAQLKRHRDTAVAGAIVACPTSLHERVASQCLQRGWHVLVEKPMAHSQRAARRLIARAKEVGKVLQVGHLERFNGAIEAALPMVEAPQFISAERLGPFSGRSPEVDVIYDLMVHDLDLVAQVVRGPLVEARAIGVSVLTEATDMASARLVFADGCVAQLAAGRASLKPVRKMRFFTPRRYVSVDCLEREVSCVRREPPPTGRGWPRLIPEPCQVAEGDALSRQLEAFIAAMLGTQPCRIDGEQGLTALVLADRVRRAIAHHARKLASGASAPHSWHGHR